MKKKQGTVIPLPDLLDESGQVISPYNRMGFLVRDTHREFRRILQMLIAQHGLSASRWSYMWALWHQDGLTQKDLADRVKLEGPTVGAAVRVLIRRGFLLRQRNPADRREWRIFLTSKSKRLKGELLAVVHRINTEALEDFDEQEAYQLAGHLMKLRQGLQRMRTRLEGERKVAQKKRSTPPRTPRRARA